jgi:hypothetical protein
LTIVSGCRLRFIRRWASRNATAPAFDFPFINPHAMRNFREKRVSARPGIVRMSVMPGMIADRLPALQQRTERFVSGRWWHENRVRWLDERMPRQ